jgi:ADP-ribose pyrophosphatase
MEKKIQTLASLGASSFSVRLDEVRLKDNSTGKRIMIDHPMAAAIIPFISDSEIIMVRQFRYAVGRETLEIPAGKLDPGEEPEECIRRELVEETGYKAGQLKFICSYAPAIGYSNELIHIYSGSNLTKISQKIDEREISSVQRIQIQEVRDLIKKGVILDGKTMLGLSML